MIFPRIWGIKCAIERLHTVLYPATVLLTKSCWLLWFPSQTIFEKVLSLSCYQPLYTLASCMLKYYKRVKYSCFNSLIKSLSLFKEKKMLMHVNLSFLLPLSLKHLVPKICTIDCFNLLSFTKSVFKHIFPSLTFRWPRTNEGKIYYVFFL